MAIKRFMATTLVVLATSALASTAWADTVLDFEGLSTSASGGSFAGNPLDEDGYRLMQVGGDGSHDGLYAFEDGWQSGRGSSNGTTTASVWEDGATSVTFSLAAVGGGAFDLLSIDLGEVVKQGDFAYAGNASGVLVTGTLSGGGTVTESISLDGLSDGPGGITDFQTHTFSAAWAQLLSVTFEATNSANAYGINLNFDNIHVSASAVPEPATLGLLGVAAAGLVFVQRTRRVRVRPVASPTDAR